MIEESAKDQSWDQQHPTAERVQQHTPGEINEQMETLMRARLRDLADRLDAIDRRLAQIDAEWDMERTLEANAATIMLASLALGTRWPKWHMLSAVVAGFLLQHAVQGWCPPVAIFRRLGVRTMKEIDRERYALKALRGDFQQVPQEGEARSRADAAMEAAWYKPVGAPSD